MFSSALSRTGGYYISTDVNALNAGPVTLNSNMKIDGTWTIVQKTMGTLNLGTNGKIQATNIDLDGAWSDAPAGTIIKTGHWSTGYGTSSGLVTSSTSLANIGLTGTNANGFGVSASGAELTFNKISSNSHLLITIHFPVYQNGVSGTSTSGSMSGFAMHDGSNYVRIDSTPTHGPWDYWGAFGYGGASAGSLSYTFSTSTLSSARSAFLTKQGNVKIKFMGRSHNGSETCYFLTYGGSNPKEGTIQIHEVIAS